MERMNVKADNQGKFLFLGEHAALDFANTLMAGSSGPVETLNEYGDLLNWLALAKLISREQHMELANGLKSILGQEALLKKIREFRGLWKANLDRLVTGKPLSSDFVGLINDYLLPDLSWQVFSQETKIRSFHLHREYVPLDPGPKIFALLTGQIADFLKAAKLDYLRKCAGEDCVLFFYDTTKSHRRQWCSMAICGNRHKVASFRARQEAKAEN